MESKYPLFSVIGIEIELMIVDARTLNVLPIADQLLQKENNCVIWGNELATHVIELSLKNPVQSLKDLDEVFYSHIQKMLDQLRPLGATLLPGGNHPWMDPTKETRLWPHEGKEVYEGFHQIFDCYRHGWANLQSIHLNFPFKSEEEFKRLHSALRVLLPLIPTIAASSPFAEGRETGFFDTRLEVYSNKSSKYHELTGDVIPNVINSYAQLKKEVYDPIEKVAAQYGLDKVLSPVWCNFRGLMPRFDRGSIELRLIDSQECPKADIAIAEAIFLTAKALTLNKWQTGSFYESLTTLELVDLLKQGIRKGEDAMIDNSKFLSCFGLKKPVLAKEIWYKIYDEVLKGEMAYEESFYEILQRGILAKKLLKEFRKAGSLKPVYEKLAACLENNQQWIS